MRKYHGQLIHCDRDDWGLIEVVQDDMMRTLHFGTSARQSSMYLAQPSSLALTYTRAMASCLLFCPQPKSALLLGLGGGSLAKFLRHHFDCVVDAVELRPKVAAVAYDFFHLPRERQTRVHICDATEYLHHPNRRSYDLVLVDAYLGNGISEAVSRAEFYSACHERLSRKGVLALNLWGSDRRGLRAALAGAKGEGDTPVLKLPAEGTTNVIMLGFAAPPSREAWRTLRDRARELSANTQTEFVHYGGLLQRAYLGKKIPLLGRLGW